MAGTGWTLRIKGASGIDREVALDRDVFTIGRDPRCTIELESPYISRQHARIEVQGEGVFFVDLGSHNGSLLNGTRVLGQTPLRAGDVITIADTTIECLTEPALDERTRTLLPAAPAEPNLGEPPLADLLHVNAQTYEVFIGDRPLERRLSAQEFHLLRQLYEHRDRVCTREELGDAIWGTGQWDTNMLHRLVHRLKEKVEATPERPRYVKTVPWVGYRLTP